MGATRTSVLSRRAVLPATWLGCALGLALVCAGIASPARGQAPAVQADKPVVQAKIKTTRPAWKDLSEAQRQALQPLAAHWDGLPQERKRKWLALSQNYYAMSADEQAKLQSRMREWVLLSQQQRTQARLNYTATQKLTPEQKAAQWQAYQQLSAEEKRRLAAKEAHRRNGVAAVKLTESNKLPRLPARPAQRQESAASRATTASLIDHDTLLPRHPEHPERVERAERPERPDHSERIERIEHPERPERPERPATARGF